ncbi:MAG: ABC transporter ATP-binding protein [Actinomycetota bacterium]
MPEAGAGAHVILQVEGLKKHFSAGGVLDRLFRRSVTVRALDGVSFSLQKGRTLGVVGESGCGKTTLARTVARLYRPTEGRIRFDDEDITELSDSQFRPLRRSIQMIFQDPLASLNPRRTVGEILDKPLKVHGLDGDRRNRVDEALRSVGLEPRMHRDRYPYQLSGGQAQRVGIARSLILEPKLIIADEPVSSLDISVQAQIINLLQQLQSEHDLAFMFIAHDLSVVRQLCQDVMVMYLGKAVELAPAEELFDDPLHPYTRALLSAVPRVGSPGEPIVLGGQPPSPLEPPGGCPFHPRCPEKIGEVCEEREPQLIEARPGHHVACHLYPGA